MSYAFAMPVLPGNEEAGKQFVQALLGPRKPEYDDLQRRQGVTAERYYFQPSPGGGLFIVIGEGTFADPATFLDPEGNAFDRWFIETIEALSGINMLELGGETAEFLGAWSP
jgi:hypothetical protein